MAWRPAHSLVTLRDQVNALAPRRSKASDGTVGDAAHASRASDHNPWVRDGSLGIVTAIDITHDPTNGCDVNALVDALVANRDARIKYIIWNRRIISSQKSPWVWRAYTGRNPHTHHCHLSVLPEKLRYDSTARWTLATS